MEKKRRAGPDARVFNSRSSEGSRLPRWAHCRAGRMGRRQTSEAARTVGRRQTASRTGRQVKRIRHNDLTHYFLREHSTLPPAYLRSCNKFFNKLKLSSGGRVGPQATSSQAKIKVDKQKSNIYKYGKL